jgi:hypothetical protein
MVQEGQPQGGGEHAFFVSERKAEVYDEMVRVA